MSHVTMIRHGQANSAARDEGSYDQLSPLGKQQAQWLGAHLDATGDRFARAYSGTLRRHRETAQEMALGIEVVEDARLNELEYFTMAQLMVDQHGLAMPNNREEFTLHLPRLMLLWQQDALEGVPERFADFEARVRDVVQELVAGEGRAVAVTSGGLIGMAMRCVMGLDLTALAHACLAIENSSIHRFQPLSTGIALTLFNAVPHLDAPGRAQSRTHL